MFLIPIVLIFIGIMIANLIPNDLGLGFSEDEEKALESSFFNMKELAVLYLLFYFFYRTC